MKLPSNKKIRELFDSFRVPPQLRRHIKRVKETTLFLAKKLNEKGERYNLKLLSAAAELHDLAKPLSFREVKEEKKEEGIPLEKINPADLQFYSEKRKEFPSLTHGEMAAKILKDYPELAEVVGNHQVQSILKKNLSPEAFLLNYVDKRVAEDQVVSLRERFEGFRKRYPPSKESEELIKRFQAVEKEIFSKLDFSPADLKGQMEKEQKNG